MILLFGDNSTKTSSARKNSSVKNSKPVENSGILAMGLSQAKSLLTIGEYDTYVFSNPSVVDYSMYSNYSDDTSEDCGFMSDFSAAVAFLGGDCGFSAASYDSGSSASCSSFSSVG
jgi:hypothetical protein